MSESHGDDEVATDATERKSRETVIKSMFILKSRLLS